MDQGENVDILQDVDILQVEDIPQAMDIPQDVDIAENWLTNSTRTLKFFGHVNTSLIGELERTWRGQFVEGMVPGKKSKVDYHKDQHRTSMTPSRWTCMRQELSTSSESLRWAVMTPTFSNEPVDLWWHGIFKKNLLQSWEQINCVPPDTCFCALDSWNHQWILVKDHSIPI